MVCKATGAFVAPEKSSKPKGDLGEGTTIITAHLTVDFVSMGKGGGLLARSAKVSGKPTLQVVTGQFYLQHAELTAKPLSVIPVTFLSYTRRTGTT